MSVFGGFITGGTVSTDPGDATKLTFSGIVINGALGAVAGDTFSAGGFQVPIASIDGTGTATLVYAFPVALDGEADYAIARDSAERYNPAATNLLVRQYLAKIADASITYVVPDDGDGPTDLIAPDPQEGQKAIRFSEQWKVWLYTEGAWVEQPGAPGGAGATIITQDAEPDTDHPDNSLWIDSDSADLDVYALTGAPPAWADTGMNLKGATGPASWAPPVAWTTATAFIATPPASAVTQGGETYVCLIAHTSGTFATDLAAGKWIKVAAKGADGTGTGDMVKSTYDPTNVAGDVFDQDNMVDGTTNKNFTATEKMKLSGLDGSTYVLSVVEGDGISIDNTDPQNPIISALGGGASNRIINPNGQIWQRANSGAAAITDATYAFDRWYGLTQSAGITASQVTNAENTTPYMMRLSQANATAQRFGIAQAIESANIIDARGQDVTLSARVRMSASTTLRYAIIEWTGTADAITKDVVNSWTSTTFTPGNFFNSTTLTVTASGSVALTANTLASISLTGTVSGSANNVIVFFWTDSTQAQNVTLDIAKVQLETGGAATAIAWRPYQTEMELCHRYLRKIFEPPLRGVITGTTANRVAGPVVPSLRVSPTVSVSGNIPVFDGTGLATVSAIQTNYSTTDFLEVDLGPLSTALTSGRPAIIYRNTGAAYFLMNAEL